MIKELILEDFGMFKNKRYALKEVTVFSGKNESGKTTLFDALFETLCSPKANKKHGKKLRDRYGESRRAKAVFTSSPLRIDEDEFLNLYAIRSGDIDLDLGSGSSWLERVKSSLFTGGIDPLRLENKFEALSSEKGTLRHNRLMQELEKKKGLLKNELDELNERRNGFLAQESSVRQAGNSLKKLAARSLELENNIREMEKELDFEKKISERRQLDDLLGRIEKGDETRSRLKSLEIFSKPELEQLDSLEGKRQSLDREHDAAVNREQYLKNDVKKEREEVAALEELQQKQERQAAYAAEILERIIRFRSDLKLKRIVTWNKGMLFAAIALFVAGIGIGFLFDSPLTQVLFSGAGILAGLVLFFLARKTEQRPDTDSQNELIKRLKDEWRIHSPGAEGLLSESLEGLAQELQEVHLRLDHLIDDLAKERSGLNQLQNSLLELEEQKGEIRKRIEAAEALMREWLERRGASSRDDYVSKTVEYRKALEELQDWEEECARECENRNCASPEQLRRECERRLSELDREAVPKKGRSELETRKLEGTLKEKRNEWEGLKAERDNLREDTALEKGEIKGSLSGLPEEIISREKLLKDTASKIDKLKLDRDAAALLREIFLEISGDSESTLLELSRELKRQFGEIVPQVREVYVPELNTEAITVSDESGEKRPLAQLSRGTQDSFLLAARLALALRSHPEEAVLILDEPFHTLDSERTENALKMIRAFQEKYRWQVILFSKDDRLSRLAEKLFPGAQLIGL